MQVLEAVEADMTLDTTNIQPGSANALLLQAELDAAKGAVNKGRIGT